MRCMAARTRYDAAPETNNKDHRRNTKTHKNMRSSSHCRPSSRCVPVPMEEGVRRHRLQHGCRLVAQRKDARLLREEKRELRRVRDSDGRRGGVAPHGRRGTRRRLRIHRRWPQDLLSLRAHRRAEDMEHESRRNADRLRELPPRSGSRGCRREVREIEAHDTRHGFMNRRKFMTASIAALACAAFGCPARGASQP
jgi:hypothetical protein